MPSHLHDEHTNIPHISTGEGAPTTTPNKIGDEYIDTQNKHFYKAFGTTDSGDWENLSSN